MKIDLEIIDEVNATHTPTEQDLAHWMQHSLQPSTNATEVTLCLVDKTKSAELNQGYRHKPGPTNVLAFEYPAIPGIPAEVLGDLVICSELVLEEALQQQKPIAAHWAHLVIHGMLHLQGYDHETEPEALQMEHLETQLLQQLGFDDPYA